MIKKETVSFCCRLNHPHTSGEKTSSFGKKCGDIDSNSVMQYSKGQGKSQKFVLSQHK